jgi:hypothetical protein
MFYIMMKIETKKDSGTPGPIDVSAALRRPTDGIAPGS